MGPHYQSYFSFILLGIQAGLLYAYLAPSVDSVLMHILLLIFSLVAALIATVCEIAFLSRFDR